MKKEKQERKTKEKECKCKKVLNEKDEKIKELTADLQRVQAEFENFRKRAEKEKSEFCDCIKSEFVMKMLPVLDNFELALKNFNQNASQNLKENNPDLIKGVELIYSQLYQTLEEEGLKPILSEGIKFNPDFHEALLAEKSDKEESIILEELQKGFMFKEKVIRFAKVKVAKK